MGISLSGRFSLPPRENSTEIEISRIERPEGNSRGISRVGELGRRIPSKLNFLLKSTFKVNNSPFLPRESPRRTVQ